MLLLTRGLTGRSMAITRTYHSDACALPGWFDGLTIEIEAEGAGGCPCVFLVGVGEGECMDTSGKSLWVVAVLGCLGLLLGLATAWAQAPDPDFNNDDVVNILDISLVGSCIGVDLSTNPQCQAADTDGDGDSTDLIFVLAGEVHPKKG